MGKPLAATATAASTQTRRAAADLSSLGCIAERVAVDALAAGSAAALVAPLICIIDKGIIENASGRMKLWASMGNSFKEMVRRPMGFVGGRAFRLVYTLYAATYLTANSIDTTSSLRDSRRSQDRKVDIAATTAGTSKFLATTATNMSLCLYKDRTFARMFGTISPRPVPLPSYLLFAARDTMTIFFSFNLPAVMAPYVPIDPATGLAFAVKSAGFAGWRPETVTQMSAPAICQIFSTPLHLLGLDLYNKERMVAGGWHGRWGRVRREWGKSAIARMGRIVPAFGVGGVANAGVRRWGLGVVDARWGG